MVQTTVAQPDKSKRIVDTGCAKTTSAPWGDADRGTGPNRRCRLDDLMLVHFLWSSVPACKPHTNLKNRMGAALYKDPP